MTIATSLLAVALLTAFGTTQAPRESAVETVSVLVLTSSLSELSEGSANKCHDVCQEMRDSNNNFITHFCFRVDSPLGEGEDCWASVEECQMTTSTRCQGGEGGNGEEFASDLLLVTQDGRLVAEVTLCVVDQHVTAVRTLDFEHERQQRALEFAESL